MVDFAGQFGLCLPIKLEEHLRSGKILLAHIEDLVSPGDTELRCTFVDLIETLGAPSRSRELRFKMGICEKDEIEVLSWILLGQQRWLS
jgi:hypothetical protein